MLSPQLQLYYLTNYTLCSNSETFLASWQGLAYPSHIIQVIAFPIQAFTFWIILKKTPGTMRAMKWPLLANHAWSTWFDIMVCTLSTPYLIFPNIAFFGVGILSWLDVPYSPQLTCGLFSLLCLYMSYLYLFESRSSALPQNRFKISRKTTRIFYYSLVFLINFTLILFQFIFSVDSESSPNSEAKLKALEAYPCPPKEFFQFPLVFFILDPAISTIFLKFVLPCLLFQSFGNLGFHVGCTVFYLFLAPPTQTLSTGTRRAQRQFFLGIIFQTSIPLLIFLFPAVILLISLFTGHYRQEIMNLTVIAFGLNGLAESVAILTVHHHYRRAVKKIWAGKFKFKCREPKIQSIPVQEYYVSSSFGRTIF